LREDLPILEVVRHVAAAIMGVEELFDVERRGSRSLGQGLVSGADCAGLAQGSHDFHVLL
jgi:hypothetical protein